MECETEVKEYYKQSIVDMIKDIDNLELLIYLNAFIELKVKAEE